jgi:hypothetical protein
MNLFRTRGAGVLSENPPHDGFLKLCAVATSGQLSPEERRKLEEHLESCESCREAMDQYEAIVGHVLPAMAPEFLRTLDFDENAWSESDLHSGWEKNRQPGHEQNPRPPGVLTRWRFLSYAAAAVLLGAAGMSIYKLGVQRGMDRGQGIAAVTPPRSASAVAAPGPERQILEEQIRKSDAAIQLLRLQLDQQSATVARLKEERNQFEVQLQQGSSGSEALVQQRNELEKQLSAAQAHNVRLQTVLDELTAGSQQDSRQTKELTAQLAALQLQVKDQQDTIEQQQELLAHDRDIRELIGARDLYIAEVYDVAGAGVNKKPYGRLFYTKGKSLIFYAYDLDQNKGLKNGATFQAWGRRGPDWNQALNLGMFYEDSAAKKRWVLRFDDPKTLAQIDAVFVTVEPNGGSRKPSGQRLLFAYLKIEPNHP